MKQIYSWLKITLKINLQYTYIYVSILNESCI